MTGLALDTAGVVSLIGEAADRLLDRGRSGIASSTVEIATCDPAEVAFASRRATDSWFCWEQPDRDFSLSAIGTAYSSVSRGPDRFSQVADDTSHRSGTASVVNGPGVGDDVGPIWTGGFAFSNRDASGSTWSSFAPAEMTLPCLSIVNDGKRTLLTVNVMVNSNSRRDSLLASVRSRVESLVTREMPMLDPHPLDRPVIESVLPPGEFESAVSAATSRIAAGEIEKVVLAREIVVKSGSAHDPAEIFGALRLGFPTCFNFCVGTPQAAFVGASPELLVRRAGHTVSTVGLAGSTRRSSDPAVDDHLAERLMGSAKERAEQDLVVKRIVKKLNRLSIWVEAAPEPEIVKVANIQHLGTPILAQMSGSQSAVELAGLLHPTPAVGGEPWEKAEKVMAEVESIDRGWYAGPVGWSDWSGDGEFCVALRSALLRDREAHLFAGVGVVSGSDPASELAETEIKLSALLSVIGE